MSYRSHDRSTVNLRYHPDEVKSRCTGEELCRDMLRSGVPVDINAFKIENRTGNISFNGRTHTAGLPAITARQPSAQEPIIFNEANAVRTGSRHSCRSPLKKTVPSVTNQFQV